MPYSVRIPRPVEEKVAGFPISNATRIQLYVRVRDELSTRRRLNGRPIVAPIRCTTHRLSVDDHHGNVTSFWLWVNETEEPGVRIVLDVALVVR